MKSAYSDGLDLRDHVNVTPGGLAAVIIHYPEVRSSAIHPHHATGRFTVTTELDHRRTGSTFNTWAQKYRSYTKPKSNGLPNKRVLLAFPAVLLLFGVVLVGLGLNGTSSGMFFDQISYGNDPDLILGKPQATRSDEWNVQTVWAIAQVQQGLPAVNATHPGGMDTALPQDLPRVDWSVAFRPHLWGYMLTEIDYASAFRWWLPGFALLAATYVFLVSVVPRRPGVSALLAVGFFFSPFFQWWFLASTLWTSVWALGVMTALVWSFKSESVKSRWVWAAIVAYLTVVMAMGIYVPFIIPAVVVVASMGIALAVDHLRRRNRWTEVAKRVLPLLAGGLAASVVTILWLLEKRDVVAAFLGTAYPGARSTPTGSTDITGLVSAVASPFTQALNDQRSGILGPNSSEASTFFYLGLFLLPLVVWFIVRQTRRRKPLPWALIGLSFGAFVLLAFLFVPGWDSISRLLLLDQTTSNRVRIGMGIASLGILAFSMQYLDQERVRVGRKLAIALTSIFILLQSLVAILISRRAPQMLESVPLWWLWILLSAAAIYFIARRNFRFAAAAFLIVTVAGSGLTNPLYRGVLDLRETAVSQTVMSMNSEDPRTWVGVGNGLTTAILLESGVEAYNGFQGGPSQEMWDTVDPSGSFELAWNRLAGVNWKAGAGEPQISNPAADQIMVTFDACSQFAQENVGYVLSDDQRLDLTCLKVEDAFDLPQSSMSIYAVIPNER